MAGKWIVHGRKSEGARVNLLLFTYAGGSPSLFATWKKLFKEEINLCPVLYPGRELRKKESIPESAATLAKAFVDANESVFELPFVLFGHCTGNILTYEVAKYVKEKLGEDPMLYIASGASSPRNSVYGDVLYDDKGNEVSNMELAKRLVKLGMVTPDFTEHENFVDYYMPIYRGDVNMLGNFDGENIVKLNCDICAMYGEDDDYISVDCVKDWEAYTKGKLEHEVFPGSHFYIAKEKEELAKRITEHIEKRL